MIKPSCMREGKIREKKREKHIITVTRSCRFEITSKKAWHGIRCSSVLKPSARKLSEEKMNQIVVTLCKWYLSRNSDFCII